MGQACAPPGCVASPAAPRCPHRIALRPGAARCTPCGPSRHDRNTRSACDRSREQACRDLSSGWQSIRGAAAGSRRLVRIRNDESAIQATRYDAAAPERDAQWFREVQARICGKPRQHPSQSSTVCCHKFIAINQAGSIENRAGDHVMEHESGLRGNQPGAKWFGGGPVSVDREQVVQAKHWQGGPQHPSPHAT